MKYILSTLLLLSVFSCKTSEKKSTVPTIGFMDALKDETLEQANNGFTAVQPAILVHPDGRLQALCRSANGPICGKVRCAKNSPPVGGDWPSAQVRD